MSGLYISQNLLKSVVSHCRNAYPYEACGILAGKNNTVLSVYEMVNMEKSSISYFMDSMEQFQVMKRIRNDDMKMIAIYHSHPQSTAYPSPKDIRLAFYPEVAYVIVSLIEYDKPDIRTFRIDEGTVSEIIMQENSR
jgi:proteasome lid subunit RPN8/RPN11